MTDSISSRRAWLALVAMVPAVLVVGLDITVLSVALPTLAQRLNASTDQLQWFVMAYTITFAAAIIPAGFLADRIGPRRVLLGSLVIFGLGSLGCVLSATSAELIAARALLGVGAAGIATLSVAMVALLFPARLRGRAMLVIMSVNMLGFPLGPILGGWMLGRFDWQWIFAINLPIVVIALVSVRLAMPEHGPTTRARLDVLGLVTVSAALVLVCAGVTQAGSHDWSAVSAWLPTLGGVVLAAAFVLIERRQTHPLVPLGLFRRPRFTSGAAGAAVMSFIVSGLLFFVPQYTQAVLGATTEQSGLYLLAFAVGMVVAMPLAGRITRLLGRSGTVALGLGLAAVALALASTTTVSSSGGWLVAWAGLVGVAFALGLPTSMDLALGDLDAAGSGIGSAVLQAVRQVATTIGAAALGSVLSGGYRAALPSGLPSAVDSAVRAGVEQGTAVARRMQSAELLHQVRHAFVSGMDLVSIVCAALSGVACILAIVGVAAVRARRRAGARRAVAADSTAG